MTEILTAKGASKLVNMCANVKSGERVLIVTDFMQEFEIARAICAACLSVGSEPTILLTGQLKTDSGEPTDIIREAMKCADVIFLSVSVSMTHSQVTKDNCKRGARIVALTQWVTDMLIRGGIEADFKALEPNCHKVAKILDEGREIHLTTKAGTDLKLDIDGRLASPHVKTGVVRSGDFHPVPDIETPISPVTSEGVIVCDASIPYLAIGVPDENVILKVEKGNVVSIKGGRSAKKVEDAWNRLNDPKCYNVAELGIGLNPHCEFRGLMLEDEGVLGTCHIGVGTSITLGGTVKASSHYDFVMHKPTIKVDGFALVDEGRVTVID